MSEDDVSYLDIKPENRMAMPPKEKVWAQIGEDLTLAFIDWQMIEEMARQFDAVHKEGGEKSQSQVMSKLLVLVREEVRKECQTKP